jgi:hypothetical protein
MAFSSAIIGTSVMGNKKVTWGTFTDGSGDTGGNIDTGLISCESMFLQSGGTAVIASAPVINETLPVAGGAVTIVTADGEDGTWLAFGY